MPFGEYKDFEDCVKKNQDKDNPEAYCAEIKRKIEGEQSEDMPAGMQNDPDRVCGNIWFNGTEAQRAAFGGGAEGRGKNEKPPKAWWDDCVAKVGKMQESTERLVHLSGIPGNLSILVDKPDAKLFELEGIALAEGEFNGLFYPTDELKRVAHTLTGKPITINHSKDVRDIIGYVQSSWYEMGRGMKYRALITDDYIAMHIRFGGLGNSLELYLDEKHNAELKRLEASNLRLVRLSIVFDPACPYERCPVGTVGNQAAQDAVYLTRDESMSVYRDVLTALETKCESRYMNPEGTRYKGGFEGCIEAIMSCRGFDKEHSRKMCWYIFVKRRGSATAGK